MNETTATGNDPHSTEPCSWCPVRLWAVMHDPKNIEAEQQIRASQRQLDFKELQATARNLAWLIDRIEPEAIEDAKTREALVRIRSNTERLITLTRRRKAA